MSKNLQNFTKAASMLRNVAIRVPAQAWDNASCCDGWTAREAAGHASWVLQNIAAGANGGGHPAQQPEADVAGDDPAATVCASVDACLAALDQPGVLAKISQTPFGEMPMDNFIGAVWVDPMTHAWDIADATGIDHGIDDATATSALDQLRPMADMMRGAGVFGPEVETSSTDPIDQLVAFAGRTSVRS